MTKLATKLERELLSSLLEIKEQTDHPPALLTSRYNVFFITRLSKITLVGSVALFLTLSVINNLSDYQVIFQFVKQVMSMQSVYLHNQDSWRAITNPSLHQLSYWLVIVWETIAGVLCWWGAYRCWQVIRYNSAIFHQAKTIAIGGLTLALLLWLVAFINIGGEWFMMWQSELWNDQDTAFRMCTIVGVILAFLSLPEGEESFGYLR